MAQELRRDQPVRLPNPSAQPFVTALKTVRFFSVLFFWVAMVSVAAYAVAFVLMEWVGLYDAPPLAVQPPSEAKAPAEPGTPAEPAEKASEKSAATEKSGEKSSEPAEPLPGHRPALSPEKSAKPKTSAEKSGAQGPSFFALFENTAQAAPEPKPAPAKTPGEPNFMGVPAGPVRSASKDSEAPAAPAEKAKDIYIPVEQSADAATGDVVLVELSRQRRGELDEAGVRFEPPASFAEGRLVVLRDARAMLRPIVCDCHERADPSVMAAEPREHLSP